MKTVSLFLASMIVCTISTSGNSSSKSCNYKDYEDVAEHFYANDLEMILKLKSGDPNAINDLGLMCESSLLNSLSSTTRNQKETKYWQDKAIELCSIAAEKGSSKAVYNLGIIYYKGGCFCSTGFPKSIGLANKIFGSQ